MSKANFKEFISKDGHTTILFSYNTLVAFHTSGSNPVITARKYSTTTSKHVNAWLRKNFGSTDVAQVLRHDEFSERAEVVINKNAVELFVR